MTAGTRYRLQVRRDISATAGYGPPEWPDLPDVSAGAHAVLASRSHHADPETLAASWYGGPCSDAETPVGRALISGQPADHAAVDELLPLLRWCRLHTRLPDICELVPVDGAP